jgi:hypothetical protein
MSVRSWLSRLPLSSCPAEIWAAALLTLGTVIAFCQVANFDFVNYDDPVYVYNNQNVQGGLFHTDLADGLNLDTIEWAFSETHKSAHWHPLTWLSLALDWSLYGDNAGGFHLTNLALHLANTLLLFWVLRLSTGAVWRSAAVAGLFGWHPLHVESVAWITERKDVLSTFFWMLTMLTYVKYVQRSRQPVSRTSGPTGTWKYYFLTIVFFALGLLSKPMVVTLPCVLLLWDYWPLRRWRAGGVSPPVNPRTISVSPSPNGRGATGGLTPPSRLLLEKVPLFCLSIAAGWWTTVVMNAGTPSVRRTGEILTLGGRVQNAVLSAVVLLRKMFWPSDLAPFYPVNLDPNDDPITKAILAGVFLVACTFLAYLARRRYPYLLMGWLWYLGTLVLVSLRLQAGSFTWADRYTYVPMIGIFIALVWGLCDWFELFRWPLIIGFTALLLGCLAMTWRQVRIWENSETLWTHTLEVTDADRNFMAHYDLGVALHEKKEPEKALPHLEKAVEIVPKAVEFRARLARVHIDLGVRSLETNQPEEAIAHFREAIKNLPQFPELRGRLAQALFERGKVLRQSQDPGARPYFEEAQGIYRFLLFGEPDNLMYLDQMEETRRMLEQRD